jgi:16S rRNA (uracil1498-N3)-methyltransferase
MKKIHNIPRFYLEESLISINKGEQYHQILNVFRLTEGSQIIGIYEGKEFLLEITKINKLQIELKILNEIMAENKELPFPLRVCMPLLKGDKTEWVLQKCTELGVMEFQFIEYSRSVKHSGNFELKTERWQKIIKEAVEQSERVVKPFIKPTIKVSEIELREGERGIIFIERFSKTTNLQTFNLNKPTCLVFGPEGGFSEEEKNQLLNKKFESISLGPRILRSETAIICGCSLFSVGSYAV